MAVDAETQFHVLAVDDNLIDRKVIEKLLRSSSFHVTAVDSGSKALEFLGRQNDQKIEDPSSQSPDHHDVVEVNLIITDYCMPGMTGYDLLKRVKESSSFRDIPVVIMSSENVPSRIDRCLAEGAEEFLLKPVRRFDLSRLRPHILKAKSRGRQQPELHQKPQALQEQEHREQELQQQEKQQQPNNKRKAADEGLVQESRRPRLSGLTVL